MVESKSSNDSARDEVWCGVFLALLGPDTAPRLVVDAADEAVKVFEERGIVNAMHRVIMRPR